MITHLEMQITKFEAKPEIMHSDSVIIEVHTEKLKSLGSELKKNIIHYH